MNITVREAKVNDAGEVMKIVNNYADKGMMLRIEKEYFFSNVTNFLAAVTDNKIIGCAALVVFNDKLGELRSLAVNEKYKNKKIGTLLIEAVEKKAITLGLKRIFVLTYLESYFSGLGYKKVQFNTFPQKIWNDCLKCMKFPRCDEIAMQKTF